MKKVFCLLLVVLMALSVLTACSAAPVAEAPVAEAPAAEIPAETEAPAEPEAPAEEPPAEEAAEEPTADIPTFEGAGILDVLAIPEAYKDDAAQMGTVTRFEYQNDVGTKYGYVYTPYGYETGTDKYNVLYLMHGGNGKPDVYLQEGHSSAVQKLLDNMFANGDVAPFILVAATWNPATDASGEPVGEKNGNELVKAFPAEFIKYVLPYVDGNYRTYAEGTDEASLKAARDHRAFGGFSMGCMATWSIFTDAMAYVANFLPFSGHAGIMQLEDNSISPDAAPLSEAVKAQGFTEKDFRIFTFTGSEDIAMPNLVPQIQAMQKDAFFVFGENTFFGFLDGGLHTEPVARRYLYTSLLTPLW